MVDIYIDYAFYAGHYGGSIVTSENFQRSAMKASRVLDRISSSRVAAIIEADTETDTIESIQLAVCAIMDEQQLISEAGGVVKSESIGSQSVNYSDYKAKQSEESRILEIAELYLFDTGLLFKGFYAGEYGTESYDED